MSLGDSPEKREEEHAIGKKFEDKDAGEGL